MFQNFERTKCRGNKGARMPLLSGTDIGFLTFQGYIQRTARERDEDTGWERQRRREIQGEKHTVSDTLRISRGLAQQVRGKIAMRFNWHTCLPLGQSTWHYLTVPEGVHLTVPDGVYLTFSGAGAPSNACARGPCPPLPPPSVRHCWHYLVLTSWCLPDITWQYPKVSTWQYLMVSTWHSVGRAPPPRLAPGGHAPLPPPSVRHCWHYLILTWWCLPDTTWYSPHGVYLTLPDSTRRCPPDSTWRLPGVYLTVPDGVYLTVPDVYLMVSTWHNPILRLTDLSYMIADPSTPHDDNWYIRSLKLPDVHLVQVPTLILTC